MEIEEKFQLSPRFKKQSNVWEDYVLLTNEYKPIGLGQGFPDFLPPPHMIDALIQTINNKDVTVHQFTRAYGHPRLVSVLSKLYSPIMKKTIDPFEEIVICAGAYGALYSTIMSHIEEGDEVIVIEPFFDCYESMIRTAGGVTRFIPLRLKQGSDPSTSSSWVLNFEKLQKMFNSKTKAIILNTPHNPLGKVYNLAELLEIADLCKKWNVMCISDEVYEWLVFQPKEHIRIASLPGMWERTITIGSAGKTFCITGWKVGWAVGSKLLMRNLQIEHSFKASTLQQEAIAIGVETEVARLHRDDCFFKSLGKSLQSKKEYMVSFLTKAGMKPIIPDGGIFVVADWTPLETEIDLASEKDESKDFRFTKWFTKNVGILGIPVSMFYSEQHKGLGENFVRFCFIKNDETLQLAEETLKKWKRTK